MLDREKIIKNFEDYEPYARNLSAISMLSSDYFDMLDLLKEKEPRLMTLDEIKEYSKVAYMDRDPIWIEIRDPDGGLSLFGSFHLIESYACEGEKDPIVRYWTARPTMEQRLVVKWE